MFLDLIPNTWLQILVRFYPLDVHLITLDRVLLQLVFRHDNVLSIHLDSIHLIQTWVKWDLGFVQFFAFHWNVMISIHVTKLKISLPCGLYFFAWDLLNNVILLCSIEFSFNSFCKFSKNIGETNKTVDLWKPYIVL